MANNKIYSDYLMHYRTKGSRNGYSKDPNYTPVGEKAQGVNNMGIYGARGIGTVLGRGTATAKSSSRPKVSKEYQEEVAYNSKKNNYTPVQTRTTVSSSSTATGPITKSRSMEDVRRSQAVTLASNAIGQNVVRAHKIAENEAKRRNIKSDVGRAVFDARHDKDFGSFMKKDIADRGKKLVNKGKKKVKKLLSKLRG